MRNGLIYAVNDNEKFIEKLVNSANSFWHFNPSLRDNTTIYIITDAPNLQLPGIRPELKVKMIVLPPEAYADCKTSLKKRYTKHIFYRMEMFANEELTSLDNAIYMDVDTEFGDSIEELFVEGRTEPIIGVVRDAYNNLRNRSRKPKYGNLTSEFYYNSGFIFLTPRLIGADNLRRMRETMEQLARDYPFCTPDQDAMNVVFDMPEWKPLIHPLPKIYNFSWWTWPTCSREEADAERNYKMKHHGGTTKYEKRYINE